MIVVLVAMGARRAGAESPLERARAAFDASDYLTARTALAEALAAGDAGADELVEIYRLSGIIAAGLGDPTAAVDDFQRMLELSPKAVLPPGTSPKITKPFGDARELFKTQASIEIHVETSSSPASVTIAIVSDPLHMIASARAIARVDGGPEQTLDQPLTQTVTIPLPSGHRIDVRVAARDEHGNRLVEVGSTEVPLVIIGAEPVPPPPEKPVVPPPPGKPVAEPGEPLPIWRRHLASLALAGTSVAFAGVGIGFGLATLGAQNDLQKLAATGPAHTYSDARAIQSRGDRDALIANIGFVGAGVFAIGAAVLFVKTTRSEPDRRVTTVTPTLLPGGGAICLEGRF